VRILESYFPTTTAQAKATIRKLNEWERRNRANSNVWPKRWKRSQKNHLKPMLYFLRLVPDVLLVVNQLCKTTKRGQRGGASAAPLSI
jgi:hypothetical protein